MRITIQKSEVKGEAYTPSSKSYTIRGLMCAALASGQSELIHPLTSDDTEAALSVLKEIGVDIQQTADVWKVRGNSFRSPDGDLFCRDSAATLRFMSAICALVPGRCRLTAGPSLAKRPVDVLVEALKQWGVDISSQENTAPVTINGGKLKGGLTRLPGDISSQYVSALLFISPLTQQNAKIILTSTLESAPYVLMTLECMQAFGIKVNYSEYLREFETSPQAYRPTRYRVESDWSSASYLLGLGAVAGDVQVDNLNLQSLQGDKSITALLRDMGASLETGYDSVKVKKRRLQAIKANLTDCIDLLPTVAVLAALAHGTSEFFGFQRARLKESDRISAMKEGLEKAGIKVKEEPDRLIITGGKPHSAVIDSKNDHRIAMAFSLLGAAAGDITIENAECVSKTYPEYWDVLRTLGVRMYER